MEEKSCVAGFYIKLTDNATALPLPENELLYLVSSYRHFKYGRAIKVLFRFMYGTQESKEEALTWFNQVTVEEGKPICQADYVSKIQNFTDEQFCLLADELCIQYQAQDPKFLDIYSIKGIPYGCQNELKLIQKKMAKHPVLLFRTVEYCVKHKKNPAASRYVIQLLSKNAASHTLALESLGFNFKYRVRLSDFSNEIGTLLLAMRQSYVKKQALLTSQDSLALPLITLFREMNELDKQLHADARQGTTQKFNRSHKVSAFESDILKFIEISSDVTSDDSRFSTFTECQKKLERLGNAIITLLQAQIEYNKLFSSNESVGFLFALATNTHLSKEMFNADKHCKEAKIEYYSASEDFQNFLLEHFEAK